MRHAPAAELDRIARKIRDDVVTIPDGENAYFAAEFLAVAGRHHEALDVLRFAIDRGYCSYPALERDPSFESLRNDPQFQAVRQAGAACRQRFVEWRSQNAP